jgi:hypothetical protein
LYVQQKDKISLGASLFLATSGLKAKADGISGFLCLLLGFNQRHPTQLGFTNLFYFV